MQSKPHRSSSKSSCSGKKIFAQKLDIEQLKNLKGGSGREHDLVSPDDEYGVGIYSDGDRPPKPDRD